MPELLGLIFEAVGVVLHAMAALGIVLALALAAFITYLIAYAMDGEFNVSTFVGLSILFGAIALYVEHRH